MTSIFDELSPPPSPLNICFKSCYKSFFSTFQRKKTVSVELKMWYFPYSVFWLTGQWRGGYSPPAPLPLATLLLSSHIFFPIRLVFHQHLNSHIVYPGSSHSGAYWGGVIMVLSFGSRG